MSVGNRIKEAAQSVGGQRALAKLLSVSERTMSGYVAETSSPQLRALEEIADKTGVDLNWLVSGQAGSVSAAIEDRIAIPRYEIAAAAGTGLEPISEEVADYFYIATDWISRFAPKGANLGMIEGRGDSMEPTIRDGDALIVNFSITRQDVLEGGVFVFSDPSGVKVKRLQIMMDGKLRISSDNELYEPEYVDQEFADQSIIIHAKVILKTGKL